MRTQLSLLSLIASVGLVGCVGGLEEAPQPPQLPEEENPGNNPGNNPAGTDLSAAKALYDQNVFPIVSAKCSGGSCHTETGQVSSPIRFVAADTANAWQVATSFTALVANFTSDSAPILTKIAPGNHYGATYAPTEVTAITDWLNKEVELRNTIGGTPTGSGSGTPTGESLSQATNRVLSEFRGCMTIGDFQAANMAQAWGDMEAQNNQECENCHSTGGEGFVASRDETFFWNVFSNQKYYFLQYLTVSLIDGAANAKVIVNTVSFRGVANGQDPHREHPRFNATDNQGMTALNQFYDAVMARKAAAGCMAPSPFPMN